MVSAGYGAPRQLSIISVTARNRITYQMQEGEGGQAGRQWRLRNMAHLGFLTFVRNCSLNIFFICLAKHFSTPFLVSSLSIMLDSVCVCVSHAPPPIQCSILLAHLPPASQHSSPPCFPWVSPFLHCIPVRYLLPQHCLHSWGAGQTLLLAAAACPEQSWPTGSWE